MQPQEATSGPKIVVRFATEADRETIYRLRHQIYAEELGQHHINPEGRLTDALDAFNVYIVAAWDGEVVGFISITPPDRNTYSIDKYFRREDLPFTVDSGLYELRILTVIPSFRGRSAAFLLMYAAGRWAAAQGATRIVAIGRREVREMYVKIGLKAHGLEVRSGEVTFELMSGSFPERWAHLNTVKPHLDRLEACVDWQLGLPFRPAEVCFHGGSFFEAVGDDLLTLEKSAEVINADVLDAWFPPSPAVIRTLQEYLPWLMRTSPPLYGEGLVRALARVRGVSETNFLLGAGSSALIFLALREWLHRGSRVLLLDPSYGEYRHILENVICCQVDRLILKRARGYRLERAELEAVLAKGYDLIVLVNPNNPTGQYFPGQELEEILRGAPPGSRVWVDESYLDYVESGFSLEGFAARSRNVVVCKSLSKVYALSGMRAAYLCGPASLLLPLRAITPPWAVGLPTQAAAIQALQDTDYYALRYEETHRLRVQLQEGLQRLGIAEIYPGVANFLLCQLPAEGPDAETLVKRCQQRLLYLRNMGISSPGLGKRALRIAVKDQETNARMLAILAEALASNSITSP